MSYSTSSTVESRKIAQAHEEERQFMSQEIHDTICQSLVALKIAVQTSSTQREIIAQIDKLIDESRELISHIRPETKKPQDIILVLKEAIAEINHKYNAKITFITKIKTYTVPSVIMLQLSRIIQEALINAVTHANASKITLTINNNRQQITITINDNGKGLSESKVKTSSKYKGHGLQIMKERARQIDADFQIRSQISKGTKIKIVYRILKKPTNHKKTMV